MGLDKAEDTKLELVDSSTMSVDSSMKLFGFDRDDTLLGREFIQGAHNGGKHPINSVQHRLLFEHLRKYRYLWGVVSTGGTAFIDGVAGDEGFNAFLVDVLDNDAGSNFYANEFRNISGVLARIEELQPLNRTCDIYALMLTGKFEKAKVNGEDKYKLSSDRVSYGAKEIEIPAELHLFIGEGKDRIELILDTGNFLEYRDVYEAGRNKLIQSMTGLVKHGVALVPSEGMKMLGIKQINVPKHFKCIHPEQLFFLDDSVEPVALMKLAGVNAHVADNGKHQLERSLKKTTRPGQVERQFPEHYKRIETDLNQRVKESHNSYLDAFAKHLDMESFDDVKNKRDFNQKDRNGETLLHKAARSLNTDSLVYLLEHGADLTIRNKQGKSVIDIINEEDYYANDENHAKAQEFRSIISQKIISDAINPAAQAASSSSSSAAVSMNLPKLSIRDTHSLLSIAGHNAENEEIRNVIIGLVSNLELEYGINRIYSSAQTVRIDWDFNEAVRPLFEHLSQVSQVSQERTWFGFRTLSTTPSDDSIQSFNQLKALVRVNAQACFSMAKLYMGGRAIENNKWVKNKDTAKEYLNMARIISTDEKEKEDILAYAKSNNIELEQGFGAKGKDDIVRLSESISSRQYLVLAREAEHGTGHFEGKASLSDAYAFRCLAHFNIKGEDNKKVMRSLLEKFQDRQTKGVSTILAGIDSGKVIDKITGLTASVLLSTIRSMVFNDKNHPLRKDFAEIYKLRIMDYAKRSELEGILDAILKLVALEPEKGLDEMANDLDAILVELNKSPASQQSLEALKTKIDEFKQKYSVEENKNNFDNASLGINFGKLTSIMDSQLRKVENEIKNSVSSPASMLSSLTGGDAPKAASSAASSSKNCDTSMKTDGHNSTLEGKSNQEPAAVEEKVDSQEEAPSSIMRK